MRGRTLIYRLKKGGGGVSKQRTPARFFILYTLMINVGLGVMLVFISTEEANLYRAYGTIRLVIPSVIALVPCWIINSILFKKERLNEGILALTYFTLPVIHYITAVIVIGNSWNTLLATFIFCFIPTFAACVILMANVTLRNDDI